MDNSKLFTEEIEYLQKTEDSDDECNGQRETYDEFTINKIKGEYLNVPEDYWTYLKEIGWGSFGDGTYMIYSAPTSLEELGLGEAYPNISANYKNLSGDLAGFDLSNPNDEVIEFWHEDGEIEITKKTFRQYIRQQIGLKPKKTRTVHNKCASQKCLAYEARQ